MVVENKHSAMVERRNGSFHGAAGLLVAACLAGFPLKTLANVAESAVVENQLYLELVINSVSTGTLVPVMNQGDRYFVAVDDLKGAGLPVAASYEHIDVAHFPRINAEYDSLGQRLLLNVPPSWLPQQRIGRDVAFERAKPMTSSGAMFNYDIYTSANEDSGYSGTSVWTELRGFGEFGVVSNTGVYRHASSDDDAISYEGSGRYVRYDTTWTYADDDRVLTWELGDYVTRGLSWTGSSRMAGLQVSRDFSLRPDIITYPLPTFFGDASIPSTVDLFINGYKASSSQVDPGPFVLSSVPYINGAGEAVIVTTDALGRKVSTTMPFYVNGSLLRKGLSDFSMAAGALRLDYGSKDFSYGEGAATANWRYGLTNAITLETSAEAADGLYVGGVGTLFSIGSYGDVSLATNQSRGDFGAGHEYSYGYQYSGRGFTFAARQSKRNQDYRTLSTYYSENGYSTRKTSHVTGSVTLGRYGNLGAGYFDIEGFDEARSRIASVSWNRAMWYDSSVYLTASKEIGEDDFTTTAQFLVPLDLMGTASMTLERNASGGKSARVNYSKSVPTQGGLGYSAGYGWYEDGDNYKRFDVTWRNRYNQLQAGFYGAEDRSYWGSATGSVVLMDSQVYPSNRINDAFVLVSTDGQPDVPVRYENQLVGTTDETGHVLIPWASSSYAGKYEIDPLQLDGNYDVPLTEQRASVRTGAGYLMRFPIERMVAAMVTLVDQTGEPIPVGSYVSVPDGQGAYVGWDGQVYLEGLGDTNDLTVRLAGTEATDSPGPNTCRASFRMDAQINQIAQVGPLVCQN